MSEVTANQRVGLKRLALATGVPWAAFWGYRLWRDYQLVQVDAKYHELLVALRGSDFLYDSALDSLQNHLAWAFGPPLVIALSIWVWRGFRPQA